MHPASAFQERDPETLISRTREKGFAVVVGVAGGRPLVAHAPVLLDGAERLRFHLSAANPLSSALSVSRLALVVVSGDDAYVSPDWYAQPDQVPTWNYVSVEIEGPVRVLGRAEAVALLDDLTERFEAGLAPKPAWTRAKMDPARFEAMIPAIVAFEMTVERLTGISKLSQNKPGDEVGRLAAHLAQVDDEMARRMAEHMLRRLAEG